MGRLQQLAHALARYSHAGERSLHTAATSGVAAAAASTAARAAHTFAQGALPLRTGRQRLVILGTGWGGARLARDVDPHKWDVTIVSPRNHMVFTPLLASSCVGTLETRAVCVPIIDIQPALRQPQNFYYAAEALAVHPDDRLVEARSDDGIRFFLAYDAVAISTGSQGSTFGIPGVDQHTHFLRDASNATAIRNQLVANWNRANIPGRPVAERDRLLQVVIVGGGPTGVEFAGELSDFINRDLARIDPVRAREMTVTLVEANELLGSFDARLREYAASKLAKQGVQLMRGVVKEVREGAIELQGAPGAVIPFGLCVWSTGVGPTPFTLSLPFSKTAKGRIAVDDHLRALAPPAVRPDGTARSASEAPPGPTAMGDVDMLQDETDASVSSLGVPVPGVYALGDCCANSDAPLPALAQVAEQQGKYLAQVLNKAAGGGSKGEVSPAPAPPFVYRSLGSMATVGGRSAVIDLQGPTGRLGWTGFTSWVAWRSAYLTRLGTMKARLYVSFNWMSTLIFGRDISRW